MAELRKEDTEVKGVKTLKKQIGLMEALTVVVGVVIGSGIFFKASGVFGNAGTPALGILAWVVGGIITAASALTVAEIAAAIPKTGGMFVYLKELYSEKWAFLYGWVQTLIYVPGVAAALSIVFTTQATYFLPMNKIQQKLMAIGIIFFIMLLNIISTKLGSKVQLVSTFAKLVPIFAIILFGLLNGQAHSFSFNLISKYLPTFIICAKGLNYRCITAAAIAGYNLNGINRSPRNVP